MISILALAVATAVPATIEVPAEEPQQAGEVIVTAERTEGSDDYAVRAQTTATRLPLSQRETPQSVSVVTRAQIEDFQLNDANALLSTVPGVIVQAQETDRIYYSARGYDIQTFQIDGIGLPFAFGIQTGSIDTAIYDRIEVVRGAPGLLSATGNPSAVINFIRKRPTRDLRAVANAQYGSFDQLRLDADVSVPITSDGSVRARAVGAVFDGDSYLDRYHLTRWTGYGIVEADLGPRTVISAGYGHQDHNSDSAMWGALPLTFTDGTRIPYARSASSGTDWSGWHVIDRQIFGDLTHEFGNDWRFKLSALRRASNENDELFYVYGTPDRATGNGILTYPGAFTADARNLTLDAYLGGKVAVGGRQHDVLLGFNRGAQRYRQGSAYDFSQVNLPITIPQMLAGTFPRPNFPTEFDDSQDTHTRQETIYGLLRLNLADPLKVMVGGNYTWALSEGVSYGTPTDFRRSRFQPFVGATLDLSANISAYASYTSIFRPQTEFDAANVLLQPVEGTNYEAGLKGEWYGGRLNASIAVFRTEQHNTAEANGFDPATFRTIYDPVDSRSQGIELEIAGQLTPGLQVSGGFTALGIKGEDGEIARTFVPRRTARLNVTYAPPAMERLKVGASAQYQSRFYLEPDGVVSSTTGQQVRITQSAYALVDLFARYELTDRFALGVNVRNLTNAKYLTALNFNQGYYGAARTVLGTISVRY